MKPRGWTFIGWALAVSCALGVVLLGLILHLDSVARARARTFEQAKKDYDLLNKLRIRYRELEARKAKMPLATGQDPQSWQSFLSGKAAEAQLPEPQIQEELPTRGVLKEHAFTVSLDAKAGASVSRLKFIQFLDRVETQRPGFKSKAIMLKFSSTQPDDLSRCSATFSHFER